MNLLCYVYNWPGFSTIAGGETYLMRLLTHLRKSHNIRICTGSKEYYEWEGIPCYPQGDNINLFKDNNDNCRWADVILCQLLGNAAGYNKANQHNKPLIFIAHNNSTGYATRYSNQDKCHVVYNSYQLRDDLFKTFGHFNGTVLHPLMPEMARSRGTKITLVNCNNNKGGHIFAQIAERLPQFEFVGVFGGYGDQFEAHLPNISYLPNGVDMQKVYADTKILLMPSEFESFGQCAMEAMYAGIPVLASATPGLKENLGDAGIFISRTDIDKYVETIVYLYGNETAYWRQSEIMLERAACVREKSLLELNKFDEWISKIK